MSCTFSAKTCQVHILNSTDQVSAAEERLHTEQLARWAEAAAAAAASDQLGGLWGSAAATRHRRRSHGGSPLALPRPRANSHLAAQHGHR